MVNRRFVVLGLPVALAACVPGEAVWAPDELVEASVYRHDAPPSLTLITMKSVGSGSGAHTALLINASQRVLWDPAGSFKQQTIPERNDLIFGITPRVLDYYISYHSRETYYTVIQELRVPAEVAEMALREAMAYGAVGEARCTVSTSEILKRLPGFENIKVTFFPNELEKQFAKFPGITRVEYHEHDADDKSIAAAQIDAMIKAGL